MAASNKSVVASSTTDFSSDSTASDDWQELTKSDYAKVIFSDLLCNAVAGTVECKFQITDSVHEDPNDYVGLFRIGYEDLSQCLVSKMLSQTKCEDDGKLQRCVFTSNELPCLDDGFYQFLYVTRDQEVCGASMPFQIKMSTLQLKENSGESNSSSENMDAGFLLVSNETERKVEEPKLQSKVFPQRNALSEQKQEEIAAWVSQNPDYYSLTEQIREHTFTIDALQQSKDLAMKEVAQLYEIINTQGSELIQLRTMVAAYEEKIKMSHCLLEEKTKEITEMRNILASYEEGMSRNQILQRQDSLLMTELKQSLKTYEEKVKLNELLLKEKQEELNRVKKESYEQDKDLKASLDHQNKQQSVIYNLKKELEEIKQKQKENEHRQVAAKTEGGSIETAIQKAQDFICTISDTIKNLDYTDEYEVDKFFKLKIQLLIILRKMKIATDRANICDRNELHKASCSIKKDETRNSSVDPMSGILAYTDAFAKVAATTNTPQKENSVDPMSDILANTDAFPKVAMAKNTPQMERSRTTVPASSVKTVSSPESNKKGRSNKRASKKATKRTNFDGPTVLMRSIYDFLDRETRALPRLDIIKEDTAKTLQTDNFLDAEDIVVINNLTEKISNRGFKICELLEVIEDSVSDSGSDVSELSECTSSLKRDLICLTKVMKVLSSDVPQHINLDNLLVVEKEEDKNLLHKNNYKELLQKCSLRYRIELLHEHIEKQNEGIKKLSEKICDLMTKYMLMKDEVDESKAVSEKCQSSMIKKEMHITRLQGELDFKNSLLCHYFSKKEKLESQLDLAENTIKDYRARIMEASRIYKSQYTEIERLSKQVKKYKPVQDKPKSSKGEFSQPSSKSSNSSSSFEVLTKDSKQNVNDSDTGERMFGKASLEELEEPKSVLYSAKEYIKMFRQAGRTFCNFKTKEDKDESVQTKADLNTKKKEITIKGPAVRDLGFDDNVSEIVYEYEGDISDNEAFQVLQIPPLINSDKKSNTVTERCLNPSLDPCIEVLESAHLSETLPSTHELQCRDLIENPIVNRPNIAKSECKSNETSLVFSDFASYEHFQDVIKENFVKIKKPTSKDSQECFISCYICKTMLSLGPKNSTDLMNHLENEHSMKVCPICGQLFEDAIPPKYFQIHVDQHFETQ